MNGRFKIYFRRRQNQYQGDNVLVQCDPATGIAKYVPGTVDNVTPWDGIIPADSWYDFTDYIDQAEAITLTWDKTNTGGSPATGVSQDGSNYDKGISSELMIFDKGHAFVYDWLLSTECSTLNCIEVKIDDKIAGGVYRTFEIKGDNLDYMPIDEPCQFYIRLREQDGIWHCVHKNFIWDNFQNWFDDSTVKEHPCFFTCIEPNPRILMSARLSLSLFVYSTPVFPIIQAITNLKSIKEDSRRVLHADRFVDSPFVRTYIENIAKKCGLTMDTIFDSGKEWENLCIFYPISGFMHKNDDDSLTSPALFYHTDNRWMVTLAELLDKLKVVFAAEWYVTPFNQIQFKYIKDMMNMDPIYDFTAATSTPIYNLKYSFNGDKKSAYGRYQYIDDGADFASMQMDTLYNDIVDYDGPAMNPMLEGEKSKTFDFAPTGFVRDGRTEDYLRATLGEGDIGFYIILAIFLVLIIALTGGTLSAIAAAILAVMYAAQIIIHIVQMGVLRDEFMYSPKYTGAVRITSEQTTVPRLLLWDGISLERAMVEKSTGFPAANPYYNPDNTQYDVANEINSNNDNPNKTVYNYPLYFDSMYYGNLFDKYHDQIDNPLKSLETNQTVTFSVDLCEDMLNLFGVFENEYAQIGKVVKIEKRANYDVYARISNINVDYGTSTITIKATVIRRKSSTQFPNIQPPGFGSGTPLPPTIPPLPGSLTHEFSGVTPPIIDTPVDQPPLAQVCLIWKNNDVTGKFVTYRTSDGVIHTEFIDIGGTFEATEVINTGDIVGITAIGVCSSHLPDVPTQSASGGTCVEYANLTFTDATDVHYIDCDGVEHIGVTIPKLTSFCASEVISFGNCGNIVRTGLCGTCVPQSSTTTATCYIIDFDGTRIADANGDRVKWCIDPNLGI